MRKFFKDMAEKHKDATPYDEAKFLENWKRIDENGDGKVEFHEMLNYMKAKAQAEGLLIEH